MEEQIQMSVDKEAEITGQNNVLSQQVENKNLEIESVSQDLNDVLLEIAQETAAKKISCSSIFFRIICTLVKQKLWKKQKK